MNYGLIFYPRKKCIVLKVIRIIHGDVVTICTSNCPWWYNRNDNQSILLKLTMGFMTFNRVFYFILFYFFQFTSIMQSKNYKKRIKNSLHIKYKFPCVRKFFLSQLIKAKKGNAKYIILCGRKNSFLWLYIFIESIESWIFTAKHSWNGEVRSHMTRLQIVLY